VVLGGLLATALAGVAAPGTAAPGGERGTADGRAGATRVGDVTLEPCGVAARALCGSIVRPWEPGHPEAGRVRVGFALIPPRDSSRPALGTFLPHEGGPGYSTTGSASYYTGMYGPLPRRHQVLLVDQRGTGRSEPVDCPALQDLRIAYAVAAGRCGRSLGERADDYTTALSADDVAAVVRRLGLDGAGGIDVYGDSYGTFFSQVFVGRHPSLVRSVVLDASYPTYGESGWYPTQGPAMRRAFTAVCARSPECRDGGRAFLPTLRSVLDRVRERPWHGVSHDADGRRARVTVDGPSLTALAFGATYTPTFYRETTAAQRSALRGDRVPLLRLVAEALGGGTDAGNPRAYSEGLDAAVACHDYPQLYDMTAPTRTREQQYDAALARRTRRHPDTYGPFTVREYAASDWQALDWCTRWPVAPPDNPAAPPTPPGGSYPDVPVLVLSGELDTITTAAEGALVAGQFPDAQEVVVRNSFHVTALGDTDDCAQRIVRDFVREPVLPLDPAATTCAEAVEPVRAPGTFPLRLADVPPAASAGPLDRRLRRAAVAAALTVADLPDRWWNNYTGHGYGLRGGTWTYRGDPVRFRLDGVRLVPGVAVSGRALWDRYGERMTVHLRLAGRAPHGRLHGHWNTRSLDAVGVLRGRLEGSPVEVTFPAP
jgi:pimeloyl-ACP methyl ester carboxylesterase